MTQKDEVVEMRN